MQGLVEVTDLHVRYGDYEAVKGVSFSLGKGEILGIVGESGSGKSTIAKTLMGLQKPSSGTIRFQTPDVKPQTSSVKPSLQMIFQDAVGSLNPRMTVRQTLDEVLRVKGREDSKRTTTSGELLELVGLSKAVLDQ